MRKFPPDSWGTSKVKVMEQVKITHLRLEVRLQLDADLEVLAALLVERRVQTARVADLPAQGAVVALIPAQDAEDTDVTSRYLR